MGIIGVTVGIPANKSINLINMCMKERETERERKLLVLRKVP